MKKETINYSELGHERIITVADLIKEIFRKIYIVIILAVVFALLLGGYKYVKDTRAARTAAAQVSGESEDTIDYGSLTDDDMNAVANLIQVQENLDELQEYANNSVKMNINAYDEVNVNIQYYLKAEPDENNDSYSEDLTDLYSDYISNGALASDIVDKGYDLDVQYLMELISATVVQNSDESDSADDGSLVISSAPTPTTINLNIIHTDEDSAEELADMVEQCLESYSRSLMDSVGVHTLTLVNRTCTHVVDKNLWTYKYDRVNSIATMQSKIESLEEDMTDEQLAVFNQYLAVRQQGAVEDETVDEPEEGQVKVSISKKYVLAGAAAGIILACILIVLIYILRGSINKADDIRYLYNMRILGEVKPGGKQDSAAAVQYKGICGKKVQLSADRQLEVIVSNIRNACGEDGIKKVLICGSGRLKGGREFAGQLAERLEDIGVHADFAQDLPYSPEAIDRLTEYDAVILLEQIRRSVYSDIESEIRICLENGVRILGAAVIC